MSKTVKPQTFLIGSTQMDYHGVRAYLHATDQDDFMETLEETMGKHGLGSMVCMPSFYAKLCYKSLVLGKNANVTRVRDIEDNVRGCIESGHGSVFEHVWLNFVTTNCSRVFTHELVRHRVGTAFSQTSGRYVSIDKLEMVLPPELENDEDVLGAIEFLEYRLQRLREKLITEDMPFADKKRLTSAIRRLAPNGQANEIGWSCNVRALRHLIELRTSRHAEWEIRVVFNEVADIVRQRWPLLLHGATVEKHDGLCEFHNLHV